MLMELAKRGQTASPFVDRSQLSGKNISGFTVLPPAWEIAEFLAPGVVVLESMVLGKICNRRLARKGCQDKRRESHGIALTIFLPFIKLSEWVPMAK